MQATAQHQCKRNQCKFNKKPPSMSAETAAPIYQTEKTSLKLHTALGLYNLTDSELFWELQLDTRCLVGWSEQQIVVAFRGTASMKNAWSDLQVVPPFAAQTPPLCSCNAPAYLPILEHVYVHLCSCLPSCVVSLAALCCQQHNFFTVCVAVESGGF